MATRLMIRYITKKCIKHARKLTFTIHMTSLRDQKSTKLCANVSRCHCELKTNDHFKIAETYAKNLEKLDIDIINVGHNSN